MGREEEDGVNGEILLKEYEGDLNMVIIEILMSLLFCNA